MNTKIFFYTPNSKTVSRKQYWKSPRKSWKVLELFLIFLELSKTLDVIFHMSLNLPRLLLEMSGTLEKCYIFLYIFVLHIQTL